MKKLIEQKQTLDDVSELIRLMESEIEELRNIVYQFFETNNQYNQKDCENISDDFSFAMNLRDGKLYLGLSDSRKTGLKNNYQIIKELINKLK